MTTKPRTVDIFCASMKRPERLAAMIESVLATGYPARVLVGAGDVATIQTCERFGDAVECLYHTEANRRTGCTAPLNLVFRTLVRNDAIFCTDDVEFAPDSIREAMASLDEHFPDGDGVIGLRQENIPQGYDLAFPLFGRTFLDRFRPPPGDLFFPGYYHMYNDAEIGLTIKQWGRWHFEPRASVRHFHPAFGGVEDETYHKGRTFAAHDKQLWARRREEGALWGYEQLFGVPSQAVNSSVKPRGGLSRSLTRSVGQ